MRGPGGGGGCSRDENHSATEGRTLRRARKEHAARYGGQGMNDEDLKASLEREERAYEELVRIRASLGAMLAETIARDRDLSEFGRHRRDLPLLIRSADIRRTELKVELLARRLKEAEKEHRRATEATKKAGVALEEARRVYAQAANVERRSGLEARRLEELRLEEMGRLERLRSDEAEPPPPPPPPQQQQQQQEEEKEEVVVAES